MAWGYEKSFIVEHVDLSQKMLSCKDCKYYEKDDKSCMKRPLYLPEDGYNSWKNCKYFEPTKDAIKKKKIGVEKLYKETRKCEEIAIKTEIRVAESRIQPSDCQCSCRRYC